MNNSTSFIFIMVMALLPSIAIVINARTSIKTNPNSSAVGNVNLIEKNPNGVAHQNHQINHNDYSVSNR